MKETRVVQLPERNALKDAQPALTIIRRVAGNAMSLLSSNMVNKATTFALYVLVGRRLGALEFGQLSLALTIYYVAQVFSVAGLKTYVTREVARDKARTDHYLVHATAEVLVSSLLSVALLWLFVRLMGYSADTAAVILTLSLALLPYSLSAICEAVFQAWERMHYIAYANVSVNVAKVTLVFFMLALGSHVRQLVILLLISQVVVVAVEWWLMARHITRPRLSIDVGFLLRMAMSAATFLGIDGVIAITTSTSVLVLSKFAGETEVGLYSAATQLMVPMTLLYQGVALSVFPMMCRRFDGRPAGLKRITEILAEVLLAVALPAVVGLLFLAAPTLLLLYGSKGFGAAVGALQVVAWTLVLAALTSILGQVLYASLRERVTLRIVVVDAVVSLALGVVLISQFGLMGAAATALLTKVVDFAQHYWAVSRLLPDLDLVKLIWRPAAAVVAMAAYLAAMRDHEVILAAVSSAILYAVVLLVIEIATAGGPTGLRARFLDSADRVRVDQ